MKENEMAYVINICFFGYPAEVSKPRDIAYLVQQLRLGHEEASMRSESVSKPHSAA